ncbi:cryptococcal mannosyltransferase 1-domain-containing protein [Cantharellus anzutake]|uniref:cryptococcal mannosyltransferase 1-domain-containing protein n=1 Tax=Cantharellus anzutake TaxID=1750568 RepID=UPI001904DB53|nr:cryptococcal mannosyltransferase 1-domain-containing protein [Cantharellus anzutake]KAF8330785.1 cryptococcal mannosyltransferase 1-domain-containing protein [Cantharellus anzutake]
MPPKGKRHTRTRSQLVDRVNKLPPLVSIFLGIIIGLCIARLWYGEPSKSRSWSPTTSRFSQSRLRRTEYIPLPNPKQRRRILELLTHLGPHYTRECTRSAQPLYVTQARARYAPLRGLVGTKAQSSSWFKYWRSTDDLGSDKLDEDAAPDHAFQKRGVEYPPQHKYFIAINLYNSFDIIPDAFATLFRVAAILGYENVFVSIYENGSTDQTKALLRTFESLTKTVGMRVVIRASMRTRGQFNHRIEYLAEVRNAALRPLHELRDAEGEIFDTIIFMNDVLPCVDDILELIWQSRRQNAAITCAADYMFHEQIGAPVFYDNWVARDINGTALENAPFERVFRDPESSLRFQRHLPIQVQSCWNGVAVLDPAPLYAIPPVKFRMANIAEGECSASECSLIGNDYWNAGYGRIITVPRVKLAYDQRVYDIIHPPRRNLSVIRGFSRMGGLPDDPRSDPQDRSWYGPHDRLFVSEESEPLDFEPGPRHVWCWGWDGAGDLDGPDVEPIWENMSERSLTQEAVSIKHDRGLRK